MQLAWQPYQKFLNSLQRHFTCGGSWGPAITAEIGVPEGCPVAVVQMMVMTWMFTAAMKQKTDVDLFSYVDDWMMMTKHPEQLVCAIQQLDKLARKVGLILSLPKSHVFALQTKTARAIRGNLIHKGIKIGLAKNFQSLGVNLQTTHKLSVTLRNQRWNKAKVLLNRLQYMPWDRRRKVAILTRGIYPLIFFGVQCWPTGKDFLREVRAKSNHTIWGKQQYHLHFLAPLFSGGNYEPMLVVVMSRFRAFMRMFTQHMEQTKRVWKTSVEKKTFFKNQTKGIVGLFQNQLLELDWALQADGRCTTPDGWTFVVWEITVAQFEKRVMSSWEDKLLLQLQPKQYLTDLYSFSVTRSQYPRHKDAMLEGFMNKMRLGGLFPNQRKNKVHVQNDDCCAYCGEVDTMTHRVFSCPATEHLRSGDIWEAVRNMPTSQLFGALYPKLPLVEEYKQLLRDVQHDDLYALDATLDEHIFFTDGSAVDNELDDLRICSWAVTQARDQGPSNVTKAAGLLPGDQQSVFRAELYATNAALLLSERCHVYCDNSAVASILRTLLANGYTAKHWINHKDRDLIATTAKLLARREYGSTRISWLKAHRSLQSASSSIDLWRIYHNDKADKAAKHVLLDIPAPLAAARARIKSALQQDATCRTNAALFMRSVMDEF